MVAKVFKLRLEFKEWNVVYIWSIGTVYTYWKGMNS